MKATLTWHAGTIPGNEIWLKLGGDKGDGYFKMNFQIINTQAPNSAHNTCVFCDTLTNLNVTGQIQRLHLYDEVKVERKKNILSIIHIIFVPTGDNKFKVLLSGDCEFFSTCT